MMDLSSTVLGFATGTYTVTRATARLKTGPQNPYGRDGRYDSPTTTAIQVRACVQPVTGRELEHLPEGLRTKEVIRIFSTVALYSGADGQEPDTVLANGVTWEVATVKRWNELGNYWESLAVKL